MNGRLSLFSSTVKILKFLLMENKEECNFFFWVLLDLDVFLVSPGKIRLFNLLVLFSFSPNLFLDRSLILWVLALFSSSKKNVILALNLDTCSKLDLYFFFDFFVGYFRQEYNSRLGDWEFSCRRPKIFPTTRKLLYQHKNYSTDQFFFSISVPFVL